MNAREIIRREYGDAVNPFTPKVIGYGLWPGGAYELSCGRGLDDEPIYGLSVVCYADGSTTRCSDLSALYHSRSNVDAAIQGLKERRS